MRKFVNRRNRNIIVEAVQLGPDNVDDVANWAQAQIVEEKDALSGEASEGLNVRTPDGRKRASRGDFVIKHGDNLHISKPGAFTSNYEEVN